MLYVFGLSIVRLTWRNVLKSRPRNKPAEIELAVCFCSSVGFLAYSSTMRMEAVCSSENWAPPELHSITVLITIKTLWP
jgi:hypothetical protein